MWFAVCCFGFYNLKDIQYVLQKLVGNISLHNSCLKYIINRKYFNNAQHYLHFKVLEYLMNLNVINLSIEISVVN